MLYICIPTYNEAPTVGLLLWRIRKVFREYAREYEIVVYDDGSTDATRETLLPYAEVLPLTVIGGAEHRGYAAAVDALCRHVAKRTRYPRRDAMVLLQGDFTDQPEHIPELAKRFEGGADVVVAEREVVAGAPLEERRLRRLAPWLLRPFVSVPGVRDPFGSFRLVRIAALRDLVRERGDRPIVEHDGWAGNVELLLALRPYARRVEAVALAPRYDVRPRASRVRPLQDAMGLVRAGRRLRARRAATSAAGAGTGDSTDNAPEGA